MKFNFHNYLIEEAFDGNGVLVDDTKRFNSQNIVIGSQVSSICPLPVFELRSVNTSVTGFKYLIGYINGTAINGDVCIGGICKIPVYSDSQNVTFSATLFYDNLGTSVVPDGYYGFAVSPNIFPTTKLQALAGQIASTEQANCNSNTNNSTVQAYIINNLATNSSSNPTAFSASASWIVNVGNPQPSTPLIRPAGKLVLTSDGNYIQNPIDQWRIGVKFTDSFNFVTPTTKQINIQVAPGTKVQVYLKRGDGSIGNKFFLLYEYNEGNSGIKSIELRGGDKLIIQDVTNTWTTEPVLTF